MSTQPGDGDATVGAVICTNVKFQRPKFSPALC